MLIAISLSVSRLQKWNGFLFDSLRPLQISPLVAKLHENSFCYQQLILAKLSVIVLLLNDYLPTQGTLLVVTDSYYGNESITIRRRQFQPHTAIIQREGKA